MDRREFLATAGLVATWATVTIALSACSDDDDGGMSLTPPEGDAVGSIAANHGHDDVIVTEAQLQAGEAVRIDLSRASLGGTEHGHFLELSKEQVMDIAAGRQVIAETSTDALHQHAVTFN